MVCQDFYRSKLIKVSIYADEVWLPSKVACDVQIVWHVFVILQSYLFRHSCKTLFCHLIALLAAVLMDYQLFSCSHQNRVYFSGVLSIFVKLCVGSRHYLLFLDLSAVLMSHSLIASGTRNRLYCWQIRKILDSTKLMGDLQRITLLNQAGYHDKWRRDEHSA